jgi:hypothetical protein
MMAEFVTPESETLLKAGRGICQGWLAVVAGTMGSPSGPSTMTILTFGFSCGRFPSGRVADT